MPARHLRALEPSFARFPSANLCCVDHSTHGKPHAYVTWEGRVGADCLQQSGLFVLLTNECEILDLELRRPLSCGALLPDPRLVEFDWGPDQFPANAGILLRRQHPSYSRPRKRIRTPKKKAQCFEATRCQLASCGESGRSKDRPSGGADICSR